MFAKKLPIPSPQHIPAFLFIRIRPNTQLHRLAVAKHNRCRGGLLDHIQAVTPPLDEVALAGGHLTLGLPFLLLQRVLLPANLTEPGDYR